LVNCSKPFRKYKPGDHPRERSEEHVSSLARKSAYLWESVRNKRALAEKFSARVGFEYAISKAHKPILAKL
jgi:hypothetical protein